MGFLRTGGRIEWTLIASLWFIGCGGGGGGDGEEADAGVSGEDVQAALDVAPDAAPDAPAGTLKWEMHSPDSTKKMRAIAPVPGEPGSYVVVGDDATVLRLDGTVFSSIGPGSIGQSNLRAVWVGPQGRIAVAGEGNALLLREDDDWISAQVNPATAVTFQGVDGPDAEHLWAVGQPRAAYRVSQGTWLAAEVTVAAGDGEGLAPSSAFVAVQAPAEDDVWIAAAPGKSAAGVVLHKVGTGWKGYPLDLPPRDLWAAPGAATDPKGKVFVVGGTSKPLVAVFDGQGFVAATSDDLNWKQGFNAVRGLSEESVWAAALKGQLRRRAGKTWEVVEVASGPGVVPSFAATKDLVDLAVHGEDELAVLTSFVLYRFGVQP